MLSARNLLKMFRLNNKVHDMELNVFETNCSEIHGLEKISSFKHYLLIFGRSREGLSINMYSIHYW